MKKLLTGAFIGAAALCAHNMFAAVADVQDLTGLLPTGTSFEELTAGEQMDAGKDDAGLTVGASYWRTTGDGNVFTVTNLADLAAAAYQGDKPAIAPAGNAKCLYVEADRRLYRTALDSATLNDDGVTFSDGQRIPLDENTIYFDSMVLFTSTDVAPETKSEDKLVVWLYGADDSDDPLYGASTNLVVTAGELAANGNSTRTDYIVPNLTIEPNTWHRLTIKAKVSKGLGPTEAMQALEIPCFEVYVDGTRVSGGKWDESNSEVSATTVSLFPSLVKALSRATEGADAFGILGVAFEGTGAIDDVSFTTVAPDFAADVVAQTFNLALTVVDTDGIVDSISYAIDGGETVEVSSASGTYTHQIPVGETMLVTVELNDDGYIDGWQGADGCYTKEIDISGFAVNSEQSLTVTAVYVDPGSEDATAQDGSGNTFTVPANVVETLAALGIEDLNTKQTVGGVESALTYGQAYALGVLDLETGDIGEMPAITIAFDEDGQPVVTMDAPNARTAIYTITCELKYKNALGAGTEWASFDPAVTAQISGSLTDTTAEDVAARFYSVLVTIQDKAAPAGE